MAAAEVWQRYRRYEQRAKHGRRAHIDRNPEKNLLRGGVGYIDSWVVADEETSKFEDGVRMLRHMVKVVLVHFKECMENL